jgi:hypothetical protein
MRRIYPSGRYSAPSSSEGRTGIDQEENKVRERRWSIVAPLCLALGLTPIGPARAQKGGQKGGRTVSPLATSVAVRLPLFKAFTKGKAVFYTNFEVSDAGAVRTLGGTAFAPRLNKAKADGTDEFFFVTNGIAGQAPILGSPPGDPDYSPIWHLVRVTWKPGAQKKLLTSEEDIDAQGQNVTEQETPIHFNCPVLLVSDDLQGRMPRPAPTLALGPQLLMWSFGRGGVPVAVLFRVEGGWHDGQLFAFLGLEAAPQGLLWMPNLPPVATVPKLSLNAIASNPPPTHDPVANIWLVQSQRELVLDSVPEPDDQDVYSPLWHIHLVTFNDGKRPRPLRSQEDIEAAAMAGEVTVTTAGPDAVFNCPVIDARAVVPLPRAAVEIGFLARAGILTTAEANPLLNDLRLGNGDQFGKDVGALVGGGRLKSETGDLLLELPR